MTPLHRVLRTHHTLPAMRYDINMSDKAKFETGERVQNTKTHQVGFVKVRKGEGTYLVSIQGVGERLWDEADMEKSTEPKSEWSHTWNKKE
jgi:hypothetical protein